MIEINQNVVDKLNEACVNFIAEPKLFMDVMENKIIDILGIDEDETIINFRNASEVTGLDSLAVDLDDGNKEMLFFVITQTPTEQFMYVGAGKLTYE